MLTFQALFGLSLLAIALLGGAAASWSNIRHSRGPKERAFVIRMCAVAWSLILSMLALMYLLPAPYRYAAMLFYFIGLPWLIYSWSKKHQLIRMLDAREQDETPAH
jgi:hypothetical protein